MFKITLNMAINASSFVACRGYEIDHIEDMPGGLVRLECADEGIAYVSLHQEIEIDSDGNAIALDSDGDEISFEFRVSRPLTSNDL